MPNKIIIIVLFLFFSISLVGQNPNLRFENTMNKNGALTGSEYNNFIYQDSRGFTWISSMDGINRFDGYTIKQYKEESGIQGKNIQSDFFEDKKGNLWFSTWEALNYYDRILDSIITVPVIDEAGYKVFHLDHSKNRLWLRIANKIFWINLNDLKEFGALSQVTKGEQFSVLSDEKGQLKKIVASPWFHGTGLEVFIIKDTLVENYDRFLDEYKIINTIHLEDSFWLSFTNDTFFLFNESNPNQVTPLENTIDVSFWDIVKKDDDHLFVATVKSGLWLYSWRDNKFLKEWRKSPSPTSLSSNKPRELTLSNNYIWTSMRSEVGVEYSYLYNNDFENVLDQLKLFDTKVVSIVEDNRNQIWVGTNKNKILVFSSEGKFLNEYIVSHDPSELWQVSKNQKGEIFVVTNNHLYFFNRNTNSFQIVKNPNKLNFRSVTFVFPSRILVTTNKGIKELRLGNNEEYYLSNCAEFADYEHFSFLQLYQTSKKKVYISYGASELWIFDANNTKLKLSKKLKCKTEFYSFFESKKNSNIVWSGTSKGLMKIIKDTIFEYPLNVNSQLKSKSILGVVEDEQGILWLSTDEGLWSYNPITNVSESYTTVDGLSSNSFSLYYGSILSSKGDVWMGNDKGLTKFNPKNIHPYPFFPKAYIDELIINYDKNYKGIGDAKKLKLDHLENNLTFKIGVIGYRRSNENKVFFRLKGNNDNWSLVAPGQEINFNNLSPGSYTFQLKVQDCSGNFSPIYSLPIKIILPFWKSKWFWLFIILFGLSMIINEYRLNIQRQRTKNAESELQKVEMEQKALRSQMNPHFLLNTLTSIKALLFEKKEEEAEFYFTKLSLLIDNVLDNSKKKLITLEKELETLRVYLELEAFRYSQKFDFNISINNVHQNFIRVPPLILQPFVENSILHGFKTISQGAGIIQINIFRKGEYVVCELEDNGVGRNQIINEIKSDGIGIKNTKKRIKLHNYKNNVFFIDLKNEKNEAVGTKVIIELYIPE